LDLSIGGKVSPGSIFSMVQRILCDNRIRARIVADQQPSEKLFTYLSSTASGDGDIFYQRPTTPSNLPPQSDLMVMVKFHEEHNFVNLFPGQSVLGLPTTSYRSYTEPLQLDCSAKKIQITDIDDFDAAGHLISLSAFMPQQVIDVKANPFLALLKLGCAGSIPYVAGTYVGTNHGSYGTKRVGGERVSIVVAQSADKLNVTVDTATGGEGTGTGTIDSDAIAKSVQIQSTSANCPGSYVATLKFEGDAVAWSFKGQDCNGPVQGEGSAKKPNA
jgi:hypothetical protein